jgi:hypothetical protein
MCTFFPGQAIGERQAVLPLVCIALEKSRVSELNLHCRSPVTRNAYSAEAVHSLISCDGIEPVERSGLKLGLGASAKMQDK